MTASEGNYGEFQKNSGLGGGEEKSGASTRRRKDNETGSSFGRGEKEKNGAQGAVDLKIKG